MDREPVSCREPAAVVRIGAVSHRPVFPSESLARTASPPDATEISRSLDF
jgi:hypothetical protein